MITRLFVITIVLGLGFVNIVYAGWQEVGTAELFNHYIDPGSINKTDHFAKMWILDDYKVPQKTLDGKRIIPPVKRVFSKCSYARGATAWPR